MLHLVGTLGLAASGALAPSYTPTPAGYILSECVHEVPSGARVSKTAERATLVEPLDGAPYKIPRCDGKGWPVRRLRATPNPLPPDYDGWLEYTALNVSALGLSGGFDSFTNVMSVPNEPSSTPQQLFLFPGLQNIDWIPKHDPEPSEPFDIIQPVLQFPGSFGQKKWALKSWCVGVHFLTLPAPGVVPRRWPSCLA
jgi:hypothetical protein